MAVSESDDASDIFWPGYVDAISNLAINLLFVIAIMAIVVISSALEMQQMLKKKDVVLGADAGLYKNPKAVDQVQNNPLRQPSTDSLVSARQQGSYSQPAPSVSKVEQEQKKEIKALQEKVQTTQAELKKTTVALAQLQATVAKTEAEKLTSQKPDAGGDAADSGRQEVVTATAPMAAGQGKGRLALTQSGVIVHFNPSVMQLTQAEMQEFVTKLKTFAALNSTNRWRILVVSPKGFSESARLAFYRANAVRSILLNEGVPGALITLRILESDRASADNSRVIVKPE